MTTSEDLGEHTVWSWMFTGCCWLAVEQGPRDDMIVSLRSRREAAARIMASARFVLSEPGQSPDAAYAADPQGADMPPPLREAQPHIPGEPGPWEHGYRLTDAEADRRRIAELQATIAGLQDRLDFYEGRNVVHCMERNAGMAMHALLDEGNGTILRATDTGRQWELRGGVWLSR